jgi:hypothetical protein
MTAVSSKYRDNSTWFEGGVMSLTYRLKRTGEINPQRATPARITQRDDVAVWRDASNVGTRRYEEILGTVYDGKFKSVRL